MKQMIKQDAKGCYLVTDLPKEISQEEEFTLRMLCENRIRGLLPLQIRSFNGEKSIYYEISKLQSLETFCGIRSFSGQLVLACLTQLYRLCRILPDYFLSEDRIELSFDRIYTDGSEFCFCYAITQREPGKDTAAFAGELLGMIDHEDEEAVIYGYRFYKMATGSASLSDCLEKTLGPSDDPEGENKKKEMKEEENQRAKRRDDLSEDCDEEREKSKQNRKGRDVGGAIMYFILSLIGLSLLYLRAMQLNPLRLSLLLSSKEGILGAVFSASGLIGTALSVKAKTDDTTEKRTLQK